MSDQEPSAIAPTPVSIETPVPIPVTVVDTASTVTPVGPAAPSVPPPVMVVKGEGATLPPTTTEQQDVTTEGQRRINLIWENTQSRIAQLVVISGVLVNSVVIIFIIFFDKEVSVTQLALISISLQFINLTVGIVIGFYFSRVNHQAIGGVGPKPQEAAYTGR